MSDSTRPEFKSTIPDHLLAKATPAEAYLMRELSKNTSVTEYLLDRTDEVSKKLDYTNGRIAKAVLEIEELQRKEREKAADWETVKELSQVTELFKKKWFLSLVVVSGIFLLGFVYPTFVLTGSLGVVGHIAKWFVG